MKLYEMFISHYNFVVKHLSRLFAHNQVSYFNMIAQINRLILFSSILFDVHLVYAPYFFQIKIIF